jgi:hypothetical protein
MPTIFTKLRQACPAMAIVAVLTFASLQSSTVQADEARGTEILGRWRLTAALDSSDISSLDDREARQMIGRVLTITKDHVKFGKRDCGPPELETQIVEPSWYLREKAHASAELLRLPNPVTVIDLGCTTAFIKSPQTIVVHWKGWFFNAKRVR